MAGKKKSEDEDGMTSNSKSSQQELRDFVGRIEHLQAEKDDIAEQMKEAFAEAKGRGYDTKVLRRAIALRKRDTDEVAEEAAILDMYMEVLGFRKIVAPDEPKPVAARAAADDGTDGFI